MKPLTTKAQYIPSTSTFHFHVSFFKFYISSFYYQVIYLADLGGLAVCVSPAAGSLRKKKKYIYIYIYILKTFVFLIIREPILLTVITLSAGSSWQKKKLHIQSVPGGKDLTSGECSLGQTIQI